MINILFDFYVFISLERIMTCIHIGDKVEGIINVFFESY